jgi:hypothetical protein
MKMADEQFKFEETLGREIAAAMNDMVAPLRRRIEQLEARATVADHLKELEMRLRRSRHSIRPRRQRH